MRTGADESALETLPFDLGEIAAELTPAELAYWQNELVEPSPGDSAPGISDANAWQLNHRILKKVQAYLT